MVSFEAIPKDSECWSRGDVRQQTFPEAANSHWRRADLARGRGRATVSVHSVSEISDLPNKKF